MIFNQGLECKNFEKFCVCLSLNKSWEEKEKELKKCKKSDYWVPPLWLVTKSNSATVTVCSPTV